jgi:hypothetical protein
MATPRVALKIDVDTYRGLFLGLLARHGALRSETIPAADSAAEWKRKAIARDVYMVGEAVGSVAS